MAKLIQPQVDYLQKGLGWEVGPDGGKLFFAFTMNGDRTKIEVAGSLIDQAPELYGWTFRVGRPAREWIQKFSMTNRDGQQVEIDTTSWKYVLTGYEGQSFFDIELFAEEIPPIDETARKQSAHLVVEMMLGEELALQVIGDAILTSPLPSGSFGGETPIAYLQSHIKTLVEKG